MKSISNFVKLFFCLTVLFICGVKAEELKLEEVISKHLASIGTPEKRKELKNMVILGSSQFESKLPQRKSVGRVAIVSNPTNLLFISSFVSEIYPFEKIGYFEGKINIPFVTPGVRSPLGDFVNEHQNLLKGGLFGGTMSLNWILLEDAEKKGKLNLVGTKKVDDKKSYVIEYFGNGTSESFKIRLYFDADKFQHIRTEYREEYSGKQAKFGTLGQLSDFEINLSETFSEFMTVEGITVPTIMKTKYVVTSKDTYQYDWIFKANEVKFNQPLKEGFFTF